MKTAYCQRWRDRSAAYRCGPEVIRPSEYEVARISSEREAKVFVTQHHYEGSYPAALERFGLYRAAQLVGVAVISQPPSQAALDAALPYPSVRRGELGRFVLLDDVPANGESWFLGRVFELARRQGFGALVAHSDPEPRYTCERGCVFIGHIGTIYQATNAIYTGLTATSTRRLFSDGSVFSARAWSKLRQRERGWQCVLGELVARGAPAPDADLEEEAWRVEVRSAVHCVIRPQRDRGSHRYIWTLDRRLRAPHAVPYPKFDIGRTPALPYAHHIQGRKALTPSADGGSVASAAEPLLDI